MVRTVVPSDEADWPDRASWFVSWAVGRIRVTSRTAGRDSGSSWYGGGGVISISVMICSSAFFWSWTGPIQFKESRPVQYVGAPCCCEFFDEADMSYAAACCDLRIFRKSRVSLRWRGKPELGGCRDVFILCGGVGELRLEREWERRQNSFSQRALGWGISNAVEIAVVESETWTTDSERPSGRVSVVLGA